MTTVITILARLLSYGLVFYAGRYSMTWWYNKYLQAQAQALSFQQLQIKQEAHVISRQLEIKDEEVRKKWQDMVVDISKYQFMNQPSHLRGKWTEMDDVYLQSWCSADE